MNKLFFVLASLFSFFGVALGAFAAHMLKQKLSPDMFNIFEVGVRYHMYHALGLFIVAWAASHISNAHVAGWLFVAGIFLFSGSLYLLSITGIKWLGAITPFGGLCFLAGWLYLAWKGYQSFQ
ncbi:MAG: DUF423 domain-containing protein [Ignavibacteriales bacterium]|nr:DUF423 domain-containing protein [Ignavibacteriales bacterium]